jgi:hypothetical protein
LTLQQVTSFLPSFDPYARHSTGGSGGGGGSGGLGMMRHVTVGFIWILANCDITVLPDITAPDTVTGVLRISQSLDSDIGVTDIGNSDITSPNLKL